MANLPKAELGYAAGLLDGEGCIRIARKQSGKNQRWTYWLEVTVGNTDRRMVDWLSQRFGGDVSVHKHSASSPYRDRWRWRASANVALDFLKQVVPYLLIKKRRALYGIAFQKQIAANAATNRWGRHGMSDKEHNFRARMFERFAVLNKRGRKVPLADSSEEEVAAELPVQATGL